MGSFLALVRFIVFCQKRAGKNIFGADDVHRCAEVVPR